MSNKLHDYKRTLKQRSFSEKKKMFLIVTILSLLVSLTAASTDETLVEKAFGTQVVEATLAKIQTVCLFDKDNFFFRRLAYVETTDGNDDDTFANGFYGGIWKIDRDQFDQTKSVSTRFYTEIKHHFNIDWQTVQWKELLKPFYSGLAAHLYVEYMSANGRKLPIDIYSQSSYWDQNFGEMNEKGKFLLKAQKIEKIMCDRSASDVIFVVDGSGSISQQDFELQKEFIIDFMKSYQVGPDPKIHTRFSFLQFGTDLKEEFIFNSHVTQKDYEGAVERIIQLEGKTPTSFALDHVANKAFTEGRGARQTGASRVVIVFTDGESNDREKTKVSARKLLEKDVVVFVVGIGSTVNKDELKAIATDPDCLHLDHLYSYQDFEYIMSNIVSRTCRAPIEIGDDGSDITVGPDMKIQCRIKINRNGNTIESQVDYPTENYDNTIYFARNNAPSPSFYDYKLDFEHKTPSHLYIPHDAFSKNIYIYCYIEGKYNRTAHINISIEVGNKDPCKPNLCPKGYICVNQPFFSYKCIEDPDFVTTTTTTTTTTTATTATSLPPSTSTFDCEKHNPCTSENIAQGKFFFAHHNKKKYVQCSEWKGCWVMNCPANLVWDQTLLTCAWDH